LTAFLFLKLVTVGASLVMAAGVMARDSGTKLNRLLAGVLACTAWWALCEVMWTLTPDPEAAAWLVRFSSLGWLMVGPVFFHIFVELAGNYRSRMHRVVSYVYASSGVGLVLYIGTPWCLEAVVPTSWGWGFRFGWLFPVPFLIASVPPTLVLLSWRKLYPRQGSGGERIVSHSAVIGIAVSIAVASATDASLPFMGTQTVPLGSTSIMLTALLVTRQLRRYGYSLLSADAFAQDILGTMRDGVVLFNPDGTIRECNEALQRMADRSSDELARLGMEELLPGAMAAIVLRTEASEAELMRASGQPMPVLVSPPIRCIVRERLLGAAVVVRDHREVVDLRRRLITSARLAAVGDLSLGIANRINRPIEGVGSSLERLDRAWGRLDEESSKHHDAIPEDRYSGLAEMMIEGRELIEECQEGVARILAITRDVQGFAGAAAIARERMDLVELAENALRMALPRADVEVQIVRDFRSIPPVMASRQEMEQVLLNLLINAFHAVRGEGGEGGVVRVATEQQGSRVLVHVQDDGIGIEAEVLERIFDPFFTTKSVGEGTGLGLAISYHIVQNHGGDIQVATHPGFGSTFSVSLPVASSRDRRLRARSSEVDLV
jgi:signal transduction histidine kinase